MENEVLGVFFCDNCFLRFNADHKAVCVLIETRYDLKPI